MQAVNAIFISHCLMLCNAILTCCKLLHLSVVFITNFYIKLWYVTIRVVSVVRLHAPPHLQLLCTVQVRMHGLMPEHPQSMFDAAMLIVGTHIILQF